MDYNARYYDPGLGRFVSADTVVPQAGNPQALNRYSYVLNRPLQGGDPTGHQGPGEEDFLSAEEYDAWLHLSGRNPEFTYEQFAASRQTYYQYAADPQLYRQDLEVINGLAEGSVEEAWHSVTYATLYSEYVLHEHLLALITVDVARQGFETARTSDDPNYFLWGTTTFGAILGLASGETGQIPPYDRSAYGDWQSGVRNEVIRRDRGKCAYCGHRGSADNPLQVDHIISVKEHWLKGGWRLTDRERNEWFNDPSHLITTCRNCNIRKGATPYRGTHGP
jgi:hypothetical protein